MKVFIWLFFLLKFNESLLPIPDSSHDFTVLSTFIANTVQKYFNSLTVIKLDANLLQYAEKTMKLDTPKVIQTDKHKFNISDINSYVIIASNSTSVMHLIAELRTNKKWNARAQFLVVIEGTTSIENLSRLIADLWFIQIIKFLLAIRENNSHINLYTAFPFGSNCWNDSTPIQLCSYPNCESTNLFPNKIPKTIPNCVFKIFTKYGPPFIDDWTGQSGTLIDLMIILKQIAKIKAVYLKPEARYQGDVAQNGTLSYLEKDMIGLESLMAIGSFGINLVRYKAFDCTQYIWIDSFHWLVPAAKPLREWENLIFTFHPTAWCLIFFTFIATVFCQYLMVVRKTHRTNIGKIFLTTISTNLGMPTNEAPKTMLGRIFALTFLIYSLHFCTAFQGKLISLLTSPISGHQISTTSDIYEANLKISVQKVIPTNFVPGYIRPPFEISARHDIIFDVEFLAEQQNIATIGTITSTIFVMNKLVDSGIEYAPFYIFPEPIFISYFIALVQKGHPLFDRINSWMTRLQDMGLQDKFFRKIKEKHKIPKATKTIKLKLMNLQLAFYLLAIGELIALIVFLIELRLL